MINEHAGDGLATAGNKAGGTPRLAETLNHLVYATQWLRVGAHLGATSRQAIEARLTQIEEALTDIRNGSVRKATFKRFTPFENESRSDPAHPGLQFATPLTILQQFDQIHGDALLILDSAFATAAESQCDDPNQLRAVLGALSCIARHRQHGVLRTSIPDALAELGIQCRSGHPDGRQTGIASRSNGCDKSSPLDCVIADRNEDPLCIHMSSRSSTDSRLVIVYVGRHAPISVLESMARRIG